MEHSEKMYLVPSHQLEQLKTLAPREENIRSAAISSLDAEMQCVLQRQDLSQEDKASQYAALLQRYLMHVKKQDTEKAKISLFLQPTPEPSVDAATDPPTPPDNIFHEVLDSVSSRLKDRARLLLNKMKQNKDVSYWDDKGAFIYRGRAVPGTSMIDLVKNVTQIHALPAKRTPKGWDLFLQALAELNMPTAVVGNAATKEVLEQLKNPSLFSGQPRSLSRKASKKQRQSSTPTWLSL